MALVVTEMQIQNATLLCLFCQQKVSPAGPSMEEHVDPHILYILGRNISGSLWEALPSTGKHSHSPTPGLRVSACEYS